MIEVTVPLGWRHEGNALRRDFVFADFTEAFGFMSQVAVLAEAVDHHPDWSNSWNTVAIALTSHDKGCVTVRDSLLAEQINSLI